MLRDPIEFCEPEQEFHCQACEDLGWMEEDDLHVIPCTECSEERTYADLEKENQLIFSDF